MEDAWLSVQQAADACGLTYRTVHRMVRRGELHAEKDDGRPYRMRRADREAFIEGSRIKAGELTHLLTGRHRAGDAPPAYGGPHQRESAEGCHMAGRSTTRSRRRRRVGALAGSAATALAVLGVGSPAEAATTTSSETFEFFPFGGTSLASCTISYRADFPFSTANGARAITSVSGSNAACTTGVTTVVGAEFRNTSGDFVTMPFSFTHGTTETQTYSNVASDFHSYHQVYFPACGCASDVQVLTVPNPK